jgi:hypothetical protein
MWRRVQFKVQFASNWSLSFWVPGHWSKVGRICVVSVMLVNKFAAAVRKKQPSTGHLIASWATSLIFRGCVASPIKRKRDGPSVNLTEFVSHSLCLQLISQSLCLTKSVLKSNGNYHCVAAPVVLDRFDSRASLVVLVRSLLSNLTC